MKPAPNEAVERYRVAGPARTNCGSFLIPNRYGPGTLGVVISAGGGWDHVSVSLPARCPNWLEMCNIAELFFKDEECLMQLRPPKSDYRNYHDFCLHWWRPQTPVEAAAVKAEWIASGEELWPEYLDSTPGPIPMPHKAMV